MYGENKFDDNGKPTKVAEGFANKFLGQNQLIVIKGAGSKR